MVPVRCRRALVAGLLFLAGLPWGHGQSAGAQSDPGLPPAAFPSGTDTPLGARVAALLADPAVSRAHWGVAVMALDGTPLYGLDEGKLFRPASTAKLFTTTAALTMLGPERRFTTRVIAEGTLRDGVLHGNLLLVGGGDANLAPAYVIPYTVPQHRVADPLRDVAELASLAASAGLRRVDGNIVGDDTRFENIPYAAGVAEEDLTWGYGAPVSALVLHDNYVDLTITALPAGAPGHAEKRATIELAPSIPFYTVDTMPAPGERWRPYVQVNDGGPSSVSVRRVPGSRDLIVEGNVTEKSSPDRETVAIDDPAQYGAMALRAAMENLGVSATGVSTRHYRSAYADSYFSDSRKPDDNSLLALERLRHKLEEYFSPMPTSECSAQVVAGQPDRRVLAEHTSPPLIEDVVLTLKTSDNLHAEVMLRNIGVERDCMNNYLRTSLQMVNEYLAYAGLSRDDFALYDGSGLSTKDLVAPRAEAQLLAFAAKQPWFAQWRAALPVGGVDGTLAGRFKEAPGVSSDVAKLKGHVFAKTGTLGESRALAGYVECASGRTVIFSVLVDNHLPGTSADREAMDKIVAAIAATQ